MKLIQHSATLAATAAAVGFAALSAVAETAAPWPKAPWTPGIILEQASDPGLCLDYKEAALAHFFAGHPQKPPYRPLEKVKPVSIRLVPGMESAYDGDNVYPGDLTGDGNDDHLILHYTGGGNNMNYMQYANPVLLDVGAVQSHREHALSGEKHGRNRYEIYIEFLTNALKQQDQRPRQHPTSEPASTVARNAYELFENVQPVRLASRLYLDVGVPAKIPDYRVLISFDQEMRPKAECILQLTSPQEILSSRPWDQSPLKNLLRASKQIAGERSHCHRGTSKPFLYHRWHWERLLRMMAITPWRIFDSYYFNEVNFQAPPAPGNGYWAYDEYEYFWSLHDPYNRTAYRLFEQNTVQGINQLRNHYIQDFGLEPDLAENWAGKFLYLLRESGSDGADISNDSNTLRLAYDKSADATDFIAIARQSHNRLGQSLMYYGQDSIPQPVFDRALLLALGAWADKKVIDDILEMGASLSGGDSPAIHNAIDRPEILAHLLKQSPVGSRPTNIRNGFGKTTLMVAAHFNQLDSVKLLLDAGADPNARTWKDLPDLPGLYGEMEPDCRYQGIQHRERTALMYAAENASATIIKTLLDAGADPKALDSKGRTVVDYLARNEALTEADRNRIRKWLSKDME